ncbi:DUF4192 domain-containing protein [Trujillonella endophytica]|uniref:DUF4192 domain-containing protein n=1 Tax=Trujillonella endophytica TaxID=673521 RepID=A0A1H8PA59_9ACTN|nr:DUF4192 domain-containing protein [Trujillella endophytica]SEO38859.1 protein of unknown function [Trujillella endophytica]
MDDTLRLSDPGEIAAALPALMGFRPRESLVLVALRGPSGRLGLTARADLPPRAASAAFAAHVADRVAGSDPDAVLLVVVSEAPDDRELLLGRFPDDEVRALPHRGVVHDVVVALAERDIPVRETLLVRADRWWSYDCPHACCAPDAGTPLPGGISPVTVAAVAAGSVVEPDRAALVARIAPVRGLAADTCAAAVRRFGRRGADPATGEAAGPDAAIGQALLSCRPGGTVRLPDREVAAVVWALTDLAVRDRALGLALGADAAAAETLWTECTRRAPAPLDAAPATLLAVSAWLRGDGAMANVALERALTSVPDYGLARLLGRALDACLPPSELRGLIGQVVGEAGG